MEGGARCKREGRTCMNIKKTKWYVKPVESGGKTFYQVRRIICRDGDTMATRTEKRGGYYENKADARRLARLLNEEGDKA